jgi:alkanesulfonate monooxygenase SsuD/methylene tetrahydromethanopterin reductase-like flavin-dependent oxidoreductase (luciferase family)
MVNVLVLRGPEGTKRAWGAYRQAREDAGLPKVTTDHFGYAALAYVGDTHVEGVRVGSKLLWFLNTSLKSAPQFGRFLPGATPPEAAAIVYRSQPRPGAGSKQASAMANAATLIGLNAEEATKRGILFAGSPDTVYQQIMELYEDVGGFGHLVMVGRSGYMTHAETQKSIALIAKEVLPRLRAIAPVTVG